MAQIPCHVFEQFADMVKKKNLTFYLILPFQIWRIKFLLTMISFQPLTVF
jgi:hypothetical protein